MRTYSVGRRKRLSNNNDNNQKLFQDLSKKRKLTKRKQGKGHPSKGTGENERRQPIKTIAKTQKTTKVKCFK